MTSEEGVSMAEEKVQDYVEMTADEFAKWVCEGFDDITPEEVRKLLIKLENRAAQYESDELGEGYNPSYTDGEVVDEYTDYHLGENDYDDEYDMDEEDDRMCGELFLNLLCGRWTWYSYEGKIEHPVTQEEADRYSGMSIVKLPDDMVKAGGCLWGDCIGLSLDWKEYCVDHDIDSHDGYGFREYLIKRGIKCD